MITMDFETRSEANLKKVGAYKYATHPSTDVLCLAWAVDDGEVDLWHPSFEDQTPFVAKTKRERALKGRNIPLSPTPRGLLRLIEEGDLVEAHNAYFERCIWRFVMVEKYGWSCVEDSQWRCSAAKAASYALPRPLEDAAVALGISEQKDMEGHKLMLRMSKPRKATKDDPTSRWHQKRDDLLRLFEYCKQDVRAERALSCQLRDLPSQEIELWQLDQEMNMRGMYCDRRMAEASIKIAAQAREEASNELAKITDGDVLKTTQRLQFVRWLNKEGIRGTSVAKDVVDAHLERGNLEEHVHRALYLWRRSSKTSIKKYDAMLARISEDDRIRDLLMYHGASTGRWSGRGIQPHNFPRNTPKTMYAIIGDILCGSFERMKLLYGEDGVMDVLSSVLRGALTSAPGHDLMAADYSAIEARGTFWIAGHEEGLNIFRKIDAGEFPNQDIYTWQASNILGRLITKDDEEDRSKYGKVPVLACGYQGGWKAMLAFAPDMDKDMAKDIVKQYRSTNPLVVQFWRDVQRAAHEAVRRGRNGDAVRCGRLRFKQVGRFLHCRLPNGRLLSYLDPRVKMAELVINKGEEDEKVVVVPQLSFMGTDTHTHQWTRCSTYGGKLTENIVQALCRDIMAEAMLRLRDTIYVPVLTVHDEILAEVPEGAGGLEEFKAIMAEQPEWADGFPIEAAGWRGKRFRK